MNRRKAIHGSIVSLLCVVYQSLYRTVPSNGDLMTGLPIGREVAHPGFYSPYDLIVSSGIREPYHLYKYLGGFLYHINANVDLVWEAFFVLFLFLTFLALWYLALEFTRDTFSSAIILAIVAVAHPLRGALNASAVPLASFVNASAAMPFAFAAIVLVLQRRFLAAMALGSFVFNIHPYIGLLAGSAIATAIFFASEERLSRRLAAIIGGGLFAAPNVVYILTHLQSNFGPVAYDFYGQFRLYAMHAFVEDHWREGYGWFFLNLAGAVWLGRYIDRRLGRMVWAMSACWFALMAGYVFNSYVTKNTAILLMFLFRATYFLKPVIFIFVIHGIRRWREELRAGAPSAPWWKPWELSLAIALLFVSAILPMKLAVLADVVALIAYGFMARLIGTKSAVPKSLAAALLALGALLLILFLIFGLPQLSGARELMETILVGVVVLVAVALMFIFRKANVQSKSQVEGTWNVAPLARVAVGALTVLIAHHVLISLKDRSVPFVVDTVGMKERIMMHQAPPSTAGVMGWARTSTPQQSLFIVPPDDGDNFSAFRLAAERSVFVTIVEVNQLSLDASVYRQAHERVMALGVKIPKRREFDISGYYQLTPQALHRLAAEQHADYIVFERSRLNDSLFSIPSAYQDDRYVVLNLHAIADK